MCAHSQTHWHINTRLQPRNALPLMAWVSACAWGGLWDVCFYMYEYVCRGIRGGMSADGRVFPYLSMDMSLCVIMNIPVYSNKFLFISSKCSVLVCVACSVCSLAVWQGLVLRAQQRFGFFLPGAGLSLALWRRRCALLRWGRWGSRHHPAGETHLHGQGVAGEWRGAWDEETKQKSQRIF